MEEKYNEYKHTGSRAGVMRRAGPQRNCLWMSHVSLSFTNLRQRSKKAINPDREGMLPKLTHASLAPPTVQILMLEFSDLKMQAK